MWFVLERLEPMRVEILEEAGVALVTALRDLAQDADMRAVDLGTERRARRGSRRPPMYQPAHFREDRLEVQHALIRTHPLGILVTGGAATLDANPVPFLLDA